MRVSEADRLENAFFIKAVRPSKAKITTIK